jgi:hypothetical protein
MGAQSSVADVRNPPHTRTIWPRRSQSRWRNNKSIPQLVLDALSFEMDANQLEKQEI